MPTKWLHCPSRALQTSAQMKDAALLATLLLVALASGSRAVRVPHRILLDDAKAKACEEECLQKYQHDSQACKIVMTDYLHDEARPKPKGYYGPGYEAAAANEVAKRYPNLREDCYRGAYYVEPVLKKK